MATVLVTGAAGGMGQAVCKELVCCGWTVLGVDHNAVRLPLLAKELAGSSFHAVPADLREAHLPELIRPALDAVGGLRGLVNLAGVSQGDAIDDLADRDWEESFAVNSTAPMKLARLCAPYLRASGGGSIVNVASPVALVGTRKPSYAASKAALIGLTMSLARNLGPDNIRVNAVLPGATITHLTVDWSEEKRQRIARGTILGRLCQPVEIARVLRFLLSDDASYVTGAVLDLTAGGMYGH
jgi:NAD(P)-dependent dehydrogenase (short-subunit alcohol dehydrogenase family)